MSRQEQDQARESAGTAPGGTRQAAETQGHVPRPSPGYDDTAAAETGPGGMALGLTMLAAVLLMISGVVNFLEGLAGVIRGQFFVVNANYAYSVSTTGWGWSHIAIGAIVALVGVALLFDQLWARIAGVVIASVSAIWSFVYIPYQPIWSIIIIALDVFVIWALLTPRGRTT